MRKRAAILKICRIAAMRGFPDRWNGLPKTSMCETRQVCEKRHRAKKKKKKIAKISAAMHLNTYNLFFPQIETIYFQFLKQQFNEIKFHLKILNLALMESTM